jgi:hypothetical protein
MWPYSASWLMQFLMVSFTRGDVSSPAARHEVLASFNMPDNTTLYNTSWQVLQDPALNRLDQLPLNHSAMFGAEGLGALSQVGMNKWSDISLL